MEAQMATPTLANPQSRENHSPEYSGQLIEELTRTVEKVEQPKPPQSEPDGFTIPEAIPTDDQRRARNAEMLNALWILGEGMNLQASEIPPRQKLDPLTIALNGFPDVNTYYANREGY
jgi:hypothetical protein